MKVYTAAADMKAAAAEARRGGARIVFVPTMGFLHDGHRALMRAARSPGSFVVMSVFVNPAQFGPREDYGSYPRDITRDLKMAEEEAVDAVFTPPVGEIYPAGHRTVVEVEGLSDRLCGASRPGHFKGVATVVLKLFNIVTPDEAVFGLKDYQQFVILKRMVADLGLGVTMTGVPTVREADGLAMSSRNSYLTAEQRRAAAVIPRALKAALEEFRAGVSDPAAIVSKVKNVMASEPLAVLEYADVTDPETLEDAAVAAPGSVLAVAARVGRARLIDNVVLVQGAGRSK